MASEHETLAQGEEVSIDDLAALNAVSVAIDRLKHHEGSVPHSQLWKEKLCSPPATECELRPSTDDTKNRMEHLDRVIAVLRALEASATNLKGQFHEETVKQSQFHEETVKHGLSGLPDELLLKISAMMIEEDYYKEITFNKNLLSLAAVCRRFRDTINSNASFWTVIANKQSLCHDALSIVLQRSKNAKLTLSVHNRKAGCNATSSFVTSMHRHFHRLSSLVLVNFGAGSLSDDRGEETQIITDVLSKLAASQFPALQRLVMRVPATITGVSDDFVHIYTKWDAPSLRHLSLYDLLPRGHANLRLSSVDLRFGFGSYGQWRAPARPLTALLSFLSTQHCLEIARIEIAHCHVERDFEWDEAIILPVLRNLKLIANHLGPGGDSRCVARFIQSLWMPAVEEMTLEVCVHNLQFVESIIPRDREYPRLKVLDLYLCDDGRLPLHVSPFTAIFEQFPVLEYLSLAIADGSISGDVPEPSSSRIPPPIQTLRFGLCKRLTTEALKQVLNYLSHGPHWSEFQQLRLIQCKQPSANHLTHELDGLVPESKICVLN